MFSLFNRSEPQIGVVHFRGNTPTRAEEFEFLQKLGIELKPVEGKENARWTLRARHRDWGDAEIICPTGTPPAPKEVRFAGNLGDRDKEAIESSRSVVLVRTPAAKKTVLHDRKLLLRYLNAVMGDDAVAALDVKSQQWWTKGHLADELMHDADLDIQALYSVHGVMEPSNAADSGKADDRREDTKRCSWLHTHGLAELGAFDFDFVRPHPSISGLRGGDLLRAIAFSIAEGKVSATENRIELGYPSMPARLVSADDFMKHASDEDRAARQMHDRSHQEKRSVVCEVEKRGLMALFGGKKPRSPKWSQRDLPEQGVFHFTTAATELMAQRARNTVHLVPAILDEMKEVEPMFAAKIGYEQDGAAGSEQREHLWFQVHGVGKDTLDAELQSQPFQIARMKPGDRAHHPIDRLTDWMVMTPLGMVTPRSMHVRRMVKEQPEVVSMVKLMSEVLNAGPN